MHCNLKVARRCASRSGLFLAEMFTVLTHILLYMPAYDRNSDIGIRFGDPNFLQESNNLEMRRCFTL